MPFDNETTAQIIARIDERVLSIIQRLDAHDERSQEYVTRNEFAPVRMIAYGAVAVVLGAVITAAVAAL